MIKSNAFFVQINTAYLAFDNLCCYFIHIFNGFFVSYGKHMLVPG